MFGRKLHMFVRTTRLVSPDGLTNVELATRRGRIVCAVVRVGSGKSQYLTPPEFFQWAKDQGIAHPID